ncbi:hypothetical protein [Herbiconiux ginsengi]|uniref:HEAT repeat-containing protein n=1 Tax=Herbiconiux ginsengi TaxID=381665 RepID=A0A1H3PW68_9MICO|nr:hypothetical protein [Herbiconiux ginsengi]SDZ05562.1 hypothetical protein SAMN05216554_2156 [Herbiconiux ginsengi]
MSTRQEFRSALTALAPQEWPQYLAEHSGLPGPRGNLELAAAVGDVAIASQIAELIASDDEFSMMCGAIGLGRLLAADSDERVESELRTLATDPRWRVREGVAMALQRLGDADLDGLLVLAERWTASASAPTDAPDLLLLRAVAAGVAESRLVTAEPAALRALRILDRITATLVGIPIGARRGREDVRVLRQALGYAWSVVCGGAPDEGFASLERWAESGDPDARWIVRSNTTKARLRRLDPVRTEALGRLAGAS